MKVLICIDGGESAELVLKESKQFLIGFADKEVHVFYVSDISALAVGQGYDSTLMAMSIEHEVNELKKTAANILGNIPFHFSTETGYPGEEILKKAASLDCTLLIMGTHGRTGLDHLLIGSVAEKTLRLADCNTLVIPVKRKLTSHKKA